MTRARLMPPETLDGSALFRASTDTRGVTRAHQPTHPMSVQSLLSTRFGGKKPFLNAIAHALASLGKHYQHYQQVDLQRVRRLVFICKGNICRSAYADMRTRSLNLPSASAGLAADPGTPADPRASSTARKRGIDLSPHRSNTLTTLGVQAGDLLIAFEPGHAKELERRLDGRNDVQFTLLGLWHTSGTWAYIQDPYGLSEDYFAHCFNRIDNGLERLLAAWQDARKAPLKP